MKNIFCFLLALFFQSFFSQDISKKLEQHYKDMQDIEFTIEDGRLYILQTRNAKRTPNAVVEVAVSLAEEGVISKEEAILRVGTEEINSRISGITWSSSRRYLFHSTRSCRSGENKTCYFSKRRNFSRRY